MNLHYFCRVNRNEMGRKLKPGTIAVPMEIVELENGSFHVLVPVVLDGVNGEMIVDTGASVTVADVGLFPPGSWKKGSVQLRSNGITGEITGVHMVEVGCFRIGGLVLEEFELAVMDLGYVNEMYEKHLQRKVIGLLGSDFCIAHDAVIDYPNREMRIRVPSPQL